MEKSMYNNLVLGQLQKLGEELNEKSYPQSLAGIIKLPKV